MVVLELIAIRGVVSLANHLQNPKNLGAENTAKDEQLESGDDCTLLTAASSTLETNSEAPKKKSNHVSLADHLERNHVYRNEDDGETSISSLTTLSLASKGHCSFRPQDSFRAEDTAEDDLVQLDMSNSDLYEMARRLRRGKEDEDFEGAMTAAIQARQTKRSAPARIRRPRREGSAKNIIEAGVNRFKRNVETIASQTTEELLLSKPGSVQSFFQARVSTFARNMKTLTLMAKGDCEAPWNPNEVSEDSVER